MKNVILNCVDSIMVFANRKQACASILVFRWNLNSLQSVKYWSAKNYFGMVNTIL